LYLVLFLSSTGPTAWSCAFCSLNCWFRIVYKSGISTALKQCI